MRVIDEATGKLVYRGGTRLVVVKHVPGSLIMGYSGRVSTLRKIYFFESGELISELGDYEMLKDVLIYSPFRAGYISTVDLPKEFLIRELYTKGKGNFPYSFDRRYEAIESFNIFRGKQSIVKSEDFKISGFLKYSFGLEFETSMGYLPEDLCFRDGLIPLRDGSISGLEYSTVVMNRNTGLSLLKQQLNTLRKYTAFNKECSLHIHFGNFPLEPDYIYRVYSLCKYLEPAIARLVPPKTFNSAEYKANEKDYCKKLPTFRNFNEMYVSLVGRTFFGDLSQPHPNDIRREAKWRIPTRRK